MKFSNLLKPRHYPEKRDRLRSLLLNFILAAITVFILLKWVDNPIFLVIQDTLMSWASDFQAKVGDKNIQRMALIVIDEKTHRQWGSPLLTPRDKLKSLIEQAVISGAKTIVVDIDLVWSADGCIHQNTTVACPLTDQTSEAVLGKYLQSLNESKDNNAPIIILTRLYRYPLNQAGKMNSDDFLVAPPSFLDSYLTKEGRVFWASTFFVPSHDHVLRHWYLAPLVCDNERLTIVPSASLLAALAQTYPTEKVAIQLQNTKQKWNNWAKQFSCKDKIDKELPTLCTNVNCSDLTVSLPAYPNVRDSDAEVYLPAHRSENKIIYRFAPYDKPDVERLSLIDQYSATTLLEDEPDLQGQLVFIGNTHSFTGDYHFIPIRKNEVSGIYVLANATDTLLRVGHLRQLPKLWIFIFAVGTVLITTLAFTFYEVITAFWLASITSGIVFYLLGIFLLRLGFEMQVALPFVTLNIVHYLWHYLENFRELHHRVKGENHVHQ